VRNAPPFPSSLTKSGVSDHPARPAQAPLGICSTLVLRLLCSVEAAKRRPVSFDQLAHLFWRWQKPAVVDQPRQYVRVSHPSGVSQRGAGRCAAVYSRSIRSGHAFARAHVCWQRGRQQRNDMHVVGERSYRLSLAISCLHRPEAYLPAVFSRKTLGAITPLLPTLPRMTTSTSPRIRL
jgi:hypothetical protein